MLFGISVWNFITENSDAVDVIEYFSENGFDAVSFKPENILELPEKHLHAILKLIHENKLAVTIHAKPKHSVKQLEYIVNQFHTSLRCISIDPDRPIDPEAVFFKELHLNDQTNYLLDVSKKLNMLFGFEDFPLDNKAIKNNYDDVKDLIKSPHFGILFDIGHSNLRINDSEYFRTKGLQKYVTDIPVKIVELHVHDNNGKADQHMPPGSGNLDYGLLAEGLKYKSFSGISTLEVSPKLYHSTPAREREPTIKGMLYWRNALKNHQFI